jgi:hypothetical protein
MSRKKQRVFMNDPSVEPVRTLVSRVSIWHLSFAIKRELLLERHPNTVPAASGSGKFIASAADHTYR